MLTSGARAEQVRKEDGHMLPGRHKSVRLLLLSGFACLIVMVLTHVAEALRWFPGMGWGLSNSLGHYLDPFSAIAGVALLLIGGCVWLLGSE